MAENDYSEKVIGVSYDGTGFGTDGTIWGGEILLCDRTGFERMGSIKPFMQVGGDLSSKEGWRIATMIAGSAYGESGGEICEKLGICTAKEYKLLSIMAEKKVNAVSSTSAGRLFDAASAVLGIRRFPPLRAKLPWRCSLRQKNSAVSLSVFTSLWKSSLPKKRAG